MHCFPDRELTERLMSYGQSLAVVYFSMDIKALRAIGKITRWGYGVCICAQGIPAHSTDRSSSP